MTTDTGSSEQPKARVPEWVTRPARDSTWDEVLQLLVTVVVTLAFIAFVALPALERYLGGPQKPVPFTGLSRPSVESFIAVGLIIIMAVILSRFPWFLYTSFQSTKKARLAGEIWTDLLALRYEEKLADAGEAEMKLRKFVRAAGDAGSSPGGRTPTRCDLAMEIFLTRFEDNYGHWPFRGPLLSISVFYLIGWLAVLLPNGLSGSSVAGGTATGITGLTGLISGGMKGYIAAVASNLNSVTAAFLGAYVFSMTSLFRRYVRSDFKPTAITQASLRFVTAVIAGFLLGLMPGAPGLPPPASGDAAQKSLLLGISDPAAQQRLLLVLSFFMGIFALNAVAILWQLVSKTVPELTHLGQGLKPSALTDLDGLDAWHEDRLNEAGIDSVRGLANADFLDLLIGVRMPTQTLVDWVDQALLRMHCTAGSWRFLLKHTPFRSASDLILFPKTGEDTQPKTGDGTQPKTGDGTQQPKTGKVTQWRLDVVKRVRDHKEAKDRLDHLDEADLEKLRSVLKEEINTWRILAFWDDQKRADEPKDATPAGIPRSGPCSDEATSPESRTAEEPVEGPMIHLGQDAHFPPHHPVR